MNIVDTIFIGQLGDLELASGALSTSWSFCLFSISTGIGSGLDTLVSQSFGAKNMYLVGMWFQIAMIACFLISIPVGVLLYYTEAIMVGLGQEPHVSYLAGRYAIYLIPGLIPYALFNCMVRWLQNQHILLPSTLVALLGLVLNIPANFLFIWGVGSWKGMGLEGAALSTSLLRIIMPILLCIYVYVKKIHVDSSPRIYTESITMTNMIEYLRYAVPAMLMNFFEVAGFEFTTIMVGLLKDPIALAAHGIGLYTLWMNFLFAYAWGIACNIHLGNIVGAGEIDRCQEITFFSVLVIIADMILHGLIFWSVKSEIVKIWNPTPALSKLAQDCISIASLCMIMDGTQFTFSSLLRAVGRQKIGAIMYFFSFYVIHLPAGYVFGIVLGYGVRAFWWSLAAGISVLVLGLGIVLIKIDWPEEIRLASQRTQYEVVESDSEDLPVVKE